MMQSWYTIIWNSYYPTFEHPRPLYMVYLKLWPGSSMIKCKYKVAIFPSMCGKSAKIILQNKHKGFPQVYIFHQYIHKQSILCGCASFIIRKKSAVFGRFYLGLSWRWFSMPYGLTTSNVLWQVTSVYIKHYRHGDTNLRFVMETMDFGPFYFSWIYFV